MQDSVQNIGQHGGWQTVDEIVVPQHAAEQLLPEGMAAVNAMRQAAAWKPVRVVADSAAMAREDSLIRAVNDSLAHETSGYGIVLQDPYSGAMTAARVSTPAKGGSGDGLSWVFAALAVLFCLVCMKLKSTPRYLSSLISNLKDVHTRHNMFDNTVRETSFLVILIVAWVCCVGILLWSGLHLSVRGLPWDSLTLADRPLGGIGICTGVAAVYVIFMLLAYEMVGNVFFDRAKTRLWVKGALASMQLQAFAFFPLALLTLCYAQWNSTILAIAAVVFIIGKIQFIYKGFRIFYNHFASFLLFLYYLCSLEIVPLILAYILALYICVTWL